MAWSTQISYRASGRITQKHGSTGTWAALANRKGPSGNTAGVPKNGTVTSLRWPVARSICTATTSPRLSAMSNWTNTVLLLLFTKHRSASCIPSRRKRWIAGSCSGAMSTWTRLPYVLSSRPASSQLPRCAVAATNPLGSCNTACRCGKPLHPGHVRLL